MECGECTACCTALHIRTFNSPVGQTCKHCAGGCKIYKDRPAECSQFECFYAGQPDVPVYLRPDKCGALLEMPHGENRYFAHKVGKLDIPVVAELFTRLREMGIEVVELNDSA